MGSPLWVGTGAELLCESGPNLSYLSELWISDFSSRPWRNLPPTWVIHMATCTDPHKFLVWFSLRRHQVHVDRRVVGWSAGCDVDHPCGGQISPWPARKVTDWILGSETSFGGNFLFILDAAVLHTIGRFLLMELFYLQLTILVFYLQLELFLL